MLIITSIMKKAPVVTIKMKSKGIVPGSLLQTEFPSGRNLTDNGNGHLVNSDGEPVATIDYETGAIQEGTVSTLGTVNNVLTTDGRVLRVTRTGKILGELTP